MDKEYEKHVLDESNSMYDMIETIVRETTCPQFRIFHEGVSQRGNGWGKFVLGCTKCKKHCSYTTGSRKGTYQ